jgi:hypothetical protein
MSSYTPVLSKVFVKIQYALLPKHLISKSWEESMLPR